MKTDTWVLFSCHQTWAVYKDSKGIILSLEQWKLLSVFDAVSLQCLRFVVKETICSQCWDEVHDKVVHRPMTWMYNLCRILQHVVNPKSVIRDFSCKKSDYSRQCHRYSIFILTQYVSFVQFQDKMKAKFSNDRFGLMVSIMYLLRSIILS